MPNNQSQTILLIKLKREDVSGVSFRYSSGHYAIIIISFTFVQLNPNAFQMASRISPITSRPMMIRIRMNHQVSTILEKVSPRSISLFCLDPRIAFPDIQKHLIHILVQIFIFFIGQKI